MLSWLPRSITDFAQVALECLCLVLDVLVQPCHGHYSLSSEFLCTFQVRVQMLHVLYFLLYFIKQLRCSVIYISFSVTFYELGKNILNALLQGPVCTTSLSRLFDTFLETRTGDCFCLFLSPGTLRVAVFGDRASRESVKAE